MNACLAIFKSPGPDILQIGPISLRWYGLLIALSVFIGLNLSTNLASARGIKKGIISDLLPFIVLSSVIGARIYYVLFEWRNYSGINFWSSINLLGLKIPIPSAIEIWGGGIAIHGALIGGAISLFFFCKLSKQSFWNLMDVLVPSLALGQAIGRWGNFFNNEAFGLPTNLPWKLFIPYINRPELFSNQEFFHPTFLYESAWNFTTFIILLLLFNYGKRNIINLPSGGLSCIYLIIYSLGRVWIEGLRTDPLCLGSIPPSCEGGIRMAQLISIILIGLGSLCLLQIYRPQKKIPTLLNIQNQKKQ